MGDHRTHAAALTGVLLAGVAGAQPLGQDEGPITIGERREGWKGFELLRVDAGISFLGELRRDEVSVPGQETAVDRESRFQETFDLTAEAAIGHRNLIDLVGSFQLGLEDRFVESETFGLDEDQRDFVNLYDVSALVLGNSGTPLTVYTRREQNLVDRTFSASLDQTLSESGAILQFRSDRAPTTLHYFHRETDLDDHADQLDSTTIQDTFTAQSGIRLTDRQHLDVAYTYDRIDEEQPGFFSDQFDRHDANVVHLLTFGPEERLHELRSSVRFFNQTGEFAQEDLRLDELLLLRHTDRLETRYNLSYDEQGAGGQEQRLYRGEAQVRHRLFESLTSTASVGADRLEAPGEFSSDGRFVTAQLDYTKRVPLGRLDASVSGGFNAQDNSSRGGELTVLNEPHVFNDPFPIVLARPNIIPESIVVLPPALFPPYREGSDYTVQAFPDRVELVVIPGGQILDGQTVLVTYDVGPQPAADIDTTVLSFSVRYSLTEGWARGLGVYFRHRTRDHEVRSVDPSLFPLEELDNTVFGLEFERRGLYLRLEHEEYDSSLSPYAANRFLAGYNRPLGRASFASLDLTHEDIDYAEEDNRIVYDRVTARWVQELSRSLQFNVRLEYRNEQNDRSGDSEGFEQVVGVNWYRGQTSAYVSFSNAFLNGPGSDTTTQFLQFGVQRSF